MKAKLLTVAAAMGFLTLSVSAPLWSSERSPAETVEWATRILQAMAASSGSSIPPEVLAQGYGLAIFPGVGEPDVADGEQQGLGVALTYDHRTGWSYPIFVSLGGDDIEARNDLRSSDILLVFNSYASIHELRSGDYVLGDDVSNVAGPMSLSTEVGKEEPLADRPDILSYVRMGNAVRGMTLEGAAMKVDETATAGYYMGYGEVYVTPLEIFTGKDMRAPASAVALKRTLTEYTSMAEQ